MKTNKAPEKIYVVIDPIWGSMSVNYNRNDTDNIEYIRKDAFIKKAREWFERRNEWRDINGIKHCDMESFEDFKNYMKGE